MSRNLNILYHNNHYYYHIVSSYYIVFFYLNQNVEYVVCYIYTTVKYKTTRTLNLTKSGVIQLHLAMQYVYMIEWKMLIHISMYVNCLIIYQVSLRQYFLLSSSSIEFIELINFFMYIFHLYFRDDFTGIQVFSLIKIAKYIW